MTDTKYVRDALKENAKGKLKLSSLYGKMVNEAFKSGTTHAAKWEDKNDQSQK